MVINPRLAIIANQTQSNELIQTEIVPLAVGGINIIITNILLVVLATVWTALRLWCRKVMGGRYYLEDWMHLGALFSFYGVVASNFMMVFLGGSGHHLVQLQSWHIVRLSKVHTRPTWLASEVLC